MELATVLIHLFALGLSYAQKKVEPISEIVDMRAVTAFIELEDLYRDLHEKS